MKFRTILLIFISAVSFLSVHSCGRRGGAAFVEGQEVYTPRYARGFSVTRTVRGNVLNIYDPWQGAEGVAMQVFLARDGATAPEGFGGVALRVPVTGLVCMSSSYVAFMAELGQLDKIKGVSGAKYISNPEVREAYEQGLVHEVGYDAALSYELISAIRPDAVLAYGIAGENSVMAGKLAELGIDMIYIGDYLEESPLGKAEWLVALGYILGVEDAAVERFARIEAAYTGIRDSIRELGRADAPVVMLNSPYRDTWFVPGDRSYMVELIGDAGGRYACAGEDSNQSRPISLEDAYIKMLTADLWLNPGQVTTLAEARAENPRFAATPPVLKGNVYNNNKRQTPEGGSDFWESGAVRPDIVLRDMERIISAWAGGAAPDPDSLYYFRRLE